MGSQVASYAYLNARVSLMAEQLLHRKQRRALLQLPLSEISPLLIQAGVGALARQLPKDPAQLEQFLATILVNESIRLMRCLSSSERNFIRHWMRHPELVNLKFLLRTKFSSSQPSDPVLMLKVAFFWGVGFIFLASLPVFVNKVVRFSHAAIASFCSSARTSFGGFNQTSSILFQFLISPDQRAGFLCFAAS